MIRIHAGTSTPLRMTLPHFHPPVPLPATASAEGRQFNGAPFPASVTAEGAQFNVPPFPATVWAEGPQLNAAPFPASATAEGAQFNVSPSPYDDCGPCDRLSATSNSARARFTTGTSTTLPSN